jgi:hypothetical protein
MAWTAPEELKIVQPRIASSLWLKSSGFKQVFISSKTFSSSPESGSDL